MRRCWRRGWTARSRPRRGTHRHTPAHTPAHTPTQAQPRSLPALPCRRRRGCPQPFCFARGAMSCPPAPRFPAPAPPPAHAPLARGRRRRGGVAWPARLGGGSGKPPSPPPAAPGPRRCRPQPAAGQGQRPQPQPRLTAAPRRRIRAPQGRAPRAARRDYVGFFPPPTPWTCCLALGSGGGGWGWGKALLSMSLWMRSSFLRSNYFPAVPGGERRSSGRARISKSLYATERSRQTFTGRCRRLGTSGAIGELSRGEGARGGRRGYGGGVGGAWSTADRRALRHPHPCPAPPRPPRLPASPAARELLPLSRSAASLPRLRLSPPARALPGMLRAAHPLHVSPKPPPLPPPGPRGLSPTLVLSPQMCPCPCPDAPSGGEPRSARSCFVGRSPLPAPRPWHPSALQSISCTENLP